MWICERYCLSVPDNTELPCLKWRGMKTDCNGCTQYIGNDAEFDSWKTMKFSFRKKNKVNCKGDLKPILAG